MASDVLLLGHGSRDPQGVREFLALVQRLRQALQGRRVEAGVLEFAGPLATPIQSAADRLATSGSQQVVAQPVLLFRAGHNTEDMPRHHADMTSRYPHITFAFGNPFGLHPDLLALAHDRALAALQTLDDTVGPAGLLLVARGTHYPEANADMFKVARLFWEHYHQDFPLVEAAFVSLAQPFVPDGIERLLALGARRIVVAPYFLNTGILVKRIGDQVRHMAQNSTHTAFAVASHLGLDARVVSVLVDAIMKTEQSPLRNQA